MQYYFDRTIPGFLVKEAGFDGVPVNIDGGLGAFVCDLADIFEWMQANMADYGAPEDSAQELADVLLLKVQDTDLIKGLTAQIDSLSLALQEAEDDLENLEELDDDGQTM